MDAWYPKANRRPVPNTASPHPGEGKYLYEVAGTKSGAWLGWILHVVVGNGSPYGTFVGAKSPMRRFSHLWFAKNGAVEQYGPFTHKSWAQGDGNGQYLSCETEGLPNEPLTDAQIQSLAAFHVWTGLPDALAASPGEHGIGTHYMGGAAWGGHSCPDAVPGTGPRSHQRAGILARAKQLRTGDDDMPLSADDIEKIAEAAADKVWARLITSRWNGQPERADAMLARAEQYGIEAGYPYSRPKGGAHPGTPTHAALLLAAARAAVAQTDTVEGSLEQLAEAVTPQPDPGKHAL